MVFATVCVLLTALGHVLSSGSPLPWYVVITSVVGSSAGVWCFARRERGPVVVGLLTAGTQAVLHTAFALSQTAQERTDGPWSLGRLWWKAMTCEGAAPFPSAPFGDGPVPDAMPGMPPSLHEGMQTGGHSMLVVHLLVAALSAWWMWGGEQAAFRTARTVPLLPFLSLLLSLFRWIFFALRPAPPAVPEDARVPRQRPRRALRELLLAHVVSLRGPPEEPAVC
ncbi:PE-PGRS family protein [Streptomyces sp. MCA2]|uniref:PE-PGRS family protein n=1 Tax=Streptomyces sp. MCA2 TaxID=2944805 RepID=UPI00202225F4|nr:PE-PGRS family protein [Streptomyces sp. MCA2]MCL7494263.1 PE-PGRS family protein [Streptomyces sp. MCA2]